MSLANAVIEDRIEELLGRRAVSASICPSDVARSFTDKEDEWRACMPLVRQVAAGMAREGRLSITQGSRAVTPDQIDQGPIRLRRGPSFLGSKQ